VTATPQDPAAERVVVGDEPLPLKVVKHRRVEPLGQAQDPVHLLTGAVAHDHDRPPGGAQPLGRPRQRLGRRRDGGLAHPPGRAGRGRRLGHRSRLHAVWEDQVRDVAPHDRVLQRQAAKLAAPPWRMPT
jgi:hypothetical protein